MQRFRADPRRRPSDVALQWPSRQGRWPRAVSRAISRAAAVTLHLCCLGQQAVALGVVGQGSVRSTVHSANADLPAAEAEALQALLEGLKWPRVAPLCATLGVSCRAGPDGVPHVVGLDASGNVGEGLEGTIEGVSQLRELQTLRLGFEGRPIPVSGSIDELVELKKLQTVVLGETHVSGPLTALENLTSLSELQLQRTQVVGDIIRLQALSQLRTLWLHDTQVSGNIASLQRLVNLRTLRLSNSHVVGELAVLQSFPNLETIRITNTDISGNLASLSVLLRLQVVDLAEADVSGVVDSLRTLTNLTTLKLSGTLVDGDLAVFARLRKLQELRMHNTGIFGNLESLTPLRQLSWVELSNTPVVGPLESMGNFTQLTYLLLANTQVTGNMSSLAHLTNLTQLGLTNTLVTGTLRDLSNLTKLQWLLLNSNKGRIRGRLTDLKGLKECVLLDLAETSITGNLKDLGSMVKLRTLQLEKTNIRGSLSSLQALVDVVQIDISDTGVKGELEDVGNLMNLQVFKTSGTAVGGQLCITDATKFPVLHTLEVASTNVVLGDDCSLSAPYAFPRLQSVDLSYCPLESSLSKLLISALGRYRDLRTIIAYGCGLHGKIPDLKRFTEQFWLQDPDNPGAGKLVLDELPLANSLVNLWLQDNLLEGTALFPGRQRMSLLLLGNNPGIANVSKELLGQQNMYVVDITNTSIRGEWLFDPSVPGIVYLTRHPQMIRVSEPAMGYRCYQLGDASQYLEVTPETFAPRILCECLPGFANDPTGAGLCRRCTNSTLAHNANLSACLSCPLGASVRESEEVLRTSFDQCVCPPRSRLNDSAKQENDPYFRCYCERGRIFNGSRCLLCLQVRRVSGAQAHCSLESDAVGQWPCPPGYGGVLCLGCTEGYYRSRSGSCSECADMDSVRSGFRIMVQVLGVLLVVVAIAIAVVRCFHLELNSPLVTTHAERLAQVLHAGQSASILMVYLQLLSLLRPQSQYTTAAEEEVLGFAALAPLTLSLKSFRSVFHLDCLLGYERSTVFSAIGTPMMLPVLSILVNGFARVVGRIDIGTQISVLLTLVMFVAGYSATLDVWACSEQDAEEMLLPPDHHVHIAMPHVACNHSDPMHTVSLIVSAATMPFFMCAVPINILRLVLRHRREVGLHRRGVIHCRRIGYSQDGRLQIVVEEVRSSLGRVSKDVAMPPAGVAAYCAALACVADHRFVDVEWAACRPSTFVLTSHAREARPTGSAVGTAAYLGQTAGVGQSDKVLKLEEILHKVQNTARILREHEALQIACREDELVRGASMLLKKYRTAQTVLFEVLFKAISIAVAWCSERASKEPENIVFVALCAAILWHQVSPYATRAMNTLAQACFVCLAAAQLCCAVIPRLVEMSRGPARFADWSSKVIGALPVAMFFWHAITACWWFELRAQRIWRQLQPVEDGGLWDVSEWLKLQGVNPSVACLTVDAGVLPSRRRGRWDVLRDMMAPEDPTETPASSDASVSTFTNWTSMSFTTSWSQGRIRRQFQSWRQMLRGLSGNSADPSVELVPTNRRQDMSEDEES